MEFEKKEAYVCPHCGGEEARMEDYVLIVVDLSRASYGVILLMGNTNQMELLILMQML